MKKQKRPLVLWLRAKISAQRRDATRAAAAKGLRMLRLVCFAGAMRGRRSARAARIGGARVESVIARVSVNVRRSDVMPARDMRYVTRYAKAIAGAPSLRQPNGKA